MVILKFEIVKESRKLRSSPERSDTLLRGILHLRRVIDYIWVADAEALEVL